MIFHSIGSMELFVVATSPIDRKTAENTGG
jgi:hypothetical protein